MFSVYAANLLWRNHSVQLRKYHSYFGIPLILEVYIICRADQKTFLKNPQINIKFLFNMVDVIGFWKTKEQSLLHPTPKLVDFLVLATQKPHDISLILFLSWNITQKVGPARRPFLFLMFLKLVAKSRQNKAKREFPKLTPHQQARNPHLKKKYFYIFLT